MPISTFTSVVTLKLVYYFHENCYGVLSDSHCFCELLKIG